MNRPDEAPRRAVVRGTVDGLPGQLAFWAIVVALIVGVIWAVSVMLKPRAPLEGDDDEDDWEPDG